MRSLANAREPLRWLLAALALAGFSLAALSSSSSDTAGTVAGHLAIMFVGMAVVFALVIPVLRRRLGRARSRR
jgi:hypothetical protein